MCFGGKAYYRVLPFGLALSPRLAHQSEWRFGIEIVVLAHLKELGLRLNVRKVYFSSTDYPLIWAWCGIRPRCRHACPLLGSSQSSRQSRVREGRSLTVKRFQKLLGLMSAASNVITFGLLYMRPLQWWLKTKGFSQRGKPTLHDQGHAAMPTCLRHVEETFGFCLKAGAGSSLSRPCHPEGWSRYGESGPGGGSVETHQIIALSPLVISYSSSSTHPTPPWRFTWRL